MAFLRVATRWYGAKECRKARAAGPSIADCRLSQLPFAGIIQIRLKGISHPVLRECMLDEDFMHGLQQLQDP
jgi:hypothetical protein